jgi:replicative DNA helicase
MTVVDANERWVKVGYQDPRQPPQDLLAEQCVLGGMLLSKDAIADVVERLRAEDFYRPSHATVYTTILDLYGRGEPADTVAVAAELDRRSVLRRVGGAPYLHTLIAAVSTAANAGYYAGIVVEKATLRRLVEAGTRVVQYGYAGADGVDVAEVVDRAQAEVYNVTDERRSNDVEPLYDLLQPTLEEIDAICNGGARTGVPTGFGKLDEITCGLHPGQMVVVAARPGVGKALALATPLPTPQGWTTMGHISVGDELLGADGTPTRVVAATPIMVGRPCYDVTFSDGTVITADAEHQWMTRGGIITTAELQVGTVIPTAAPIALPAAPPVGAPAYRVGRWLAGDDRVANCGAERWAWMYLRGSLQQRRAMLRGVFEAAAHVYGSPGDGFVVDARWRRAEHRTLVVDLLCTLGHVVGAGWPGEPIVVMAAERRVTAVQARLSVPVRCVQVDGADRLYLAGPRMVPTHNSTLGLDFMRSCSLRHQLPSIIFSLEMSKSEIVMRLLSAEAKVKLADMRAGRISEEEWRRLGALMGEIADAPLYIDDSPNLTMMEIRAKARRLRQRAGLKLIVVDYLQLMTSGKKVESRQQEVSDFSRSLKLLAKELEVPVVAISQLNRGPEQRSDKRPMLSDLRESGAVEQDSDVVILLHRPDVYDQHGSRGGEADLIVAKHRNGPQATIAVAHQLHFSRFANMAYPSDYQH